jgi:succinate dehydrogenase / fumarate reductase cytochrome b subunit
VKRPVFLNLFQLRLPVMAWVSILHRVSGALLFLALPLLLWALSASLASEAGFLGVAGWASHPVSKLLLLGLVWALAHHFFSGLRHLALDIHWGVQLDSARGSSVAVLAAAVGVTLLAAWRLFA